MRSINKNISFLRRCSRLGPLGLVCFFLSCRQLVGFEDVTLSDDSALFDANLPSDAQLGAWSCIDDSPMPVPAAKTFEFELRFLDAVSSQPWPKRTVRACRFIDPQCLSSLGQTQSNSYGIARVFVQYPQPEPGFLGFFEVIGEDSVPTLMHAAPTPLSSSNLGDYSVFTTMELQALAQNLSHELSSDRGHLFVQAQNCMKANAEGVQFSVDLKDESVLPFYSENQAITSTRKETSSDGLGGFFDLPTGVRIVTGKEKISQKVLFRTTIMLRPGAVSRLHFRPVRP